ncbi:insulinase family protein [Ornithinibacillus scapharcae]|uniref:insulinase family protein n=1 Tax=Ornithinibacillus scapharcae TaxID=1147159 RepID=UPI000225B51D
MAGNFNPEQMLQMIKENQSGKKFDKLEDIQRFYPEEPEEVAKKENEQVMPVSVAKCTIGIKESVEELEGDAFIKKDLLQDMMLTYYFSKSGQFYEELYQQNIIDSSFYFETNLEKNFGYSILGGNTDDPDKFVEKLKHLLLSTNERKISEEDF